MQTSFQLKLLSFSTIGRLFQVFFCISNLTLFSVSKFFFQSFLFFLQISISYLIVSFDNQSAPLVLFVASVTSYVQNDYKPSIMTKGTNGCTLYYYFPFPLFLLCLFSLLIIIIISLVFLFIVSFRSHSWLELLYAVLKSVARWRVRFQFCPLGRTDTSISSRSPSTNENYFRDF